MMLQNDRYNRVFITLCLFVFSLISGLFLITLDIRFTGVLFTLTSIGVIGYLLLYWFLSKKNYIKDLNTLIRKETLVVAILLGVFYLIGMLESDPTHGTLSILFGISFVSVLCFLYIRYRIDQKEDTAFRNWNTIRLGFWSLMINIAIVLFSVVFYTFEIKATKQGTLVLLEEEDLLMDLLIPLIFLMLIVFILNWLIRQIKSIIRLKNEKTKTELLHLKSQVNPHFFFNTLNNLYGLVEEDSKKAQALILKLSDMMRYSIYEGEHDFVTINKEVAYLQNYIELHKMRYHKKTDVQFSCSVENKESKVMPLLFIILLENAFKHGLENLRENAYVRVNLIASNEEINFIVENNFDTEELTKKPGIGLKNLRRRLELVYPKKHSLSFSVTQDVYKVQLRLKQV
ncbi:sensor histidine kinase [Aquimarina sp. 2201CG14-23]|uniref:sensor histidine kinase n=1 Tax=Aquimarina mycalae TaxID=3040073 RepID=UPI00247829D3|nr:histidine kinase [Aquimarina sp. 2201CG14-23]MDH7445534.1 histidine kinase [Aquimarina sp. 2201CG14-23]